MTQVFVKTIGLFARGEPATTIINEVLADPNIEHIVQIEHTDGYAFIYYEVS